MRIRIRRRHSPYPALAAATAIAVVSASAGWDAGFEAGFAAGLRAGIEAGLKGRTETRHEKGGFRDVEVAGAPTLLVRVVVAGEAIRRPGRRSPIPPQANRAPGAPMIDQYGPPPDAVLKERRRQEKIRSGERSVPLATAEAIRLAVCRIGECCHPPGAHRSRWTTNPLTGARCRRTRCDDCAAAGIANEWHSPKSDSA